MKSFTRYLQEPFPALHENAVLMPLRDFIDTLQALDAQKTDQERIVEIREDVPEPETLAIRLMVREHSDEAEE